MEKAILFKEMMQNPLILNAEGSIKELEVSLGENNVERLAGLGIIEVHNGNFKLTSVGKNFIEIFNR